MDGFNLYIWIIVCNGTNSSGSTLIYELVFNSRFLIFYLFIL
jgi:hypothetical protein